MNMSTLRSHNKVHYSHTLTRDALQQKCMYGAKRAVLNLQQKNENTLENDCTFNFECGKMLKRVFITTLIQSSF